MIVFLFGGKNIHQLIILLCDLSYIVLQGGITMWKKIKPYVISVAIALGVGALSAIFTNTDKGFLAISS